MAPVDTTFYELLEVSPEVTPEELSSAYKKRALKLHPDKGGDEAQFKAMKAAYDVLKDPQKRQLYDRHGPAFVRAMEGDLGDPMELVMAFIKAASKIVLFSLPVVAALAFFPAIIFSLRWDGRISWHWAIAFIPAWTCQVVSIVILLKMRSMIDMFADAVSEDHELDEEERAAKEESQRQVKCTLSLAICMLFLLMVQQVVFALRLQGNISGSWFLIFVPYYILECFYISGRVYIKLMRSAEVENPSSVRMLPPFLWLFLRLATVMLVAAKADELLTISWILTVLPLMVGAGARLSWSCFLSLSRTQDVYSEATEGKGSGNVVGTFCTLASWLVVVLLAALKMDGRTYSAFYVFLPYFVFSSFALCCCACMACCGPLLVQAAMQEESQNPSGASGSTPLNPQSGQATYNSIQAQAHAGQMA